MLHGTSNLYAGDLVIDFRKFEPVQLGSQIYILTDKQWPVYFENIALRNVRLQPLSSVELPDFSSTTLDVNMRLVLPAEERRRILLAIPREAWDWQNTPSTAFDVGLARGDVPNHAN